jgi:hypothetical protein
VFEEGVRIHIRSEISIANGMHRSGATNVHEHTRQQPSRAKVWPMARLET